MVFPSEKGRGMSAYPYEMFQAPSGQNNSKMPHIAHKKLTPEDFPSYALFPIFDENFFILYLREDLLLLPLKVSCSCGVIYVQLLFPRDQCSVAVSYRLRLKEYT